MRDDVPASAFNRGDDTCGGPEYSYTLFALKTPMPIEAGRDLAVMLPIGGESTSQIPITQIVAKSVSGTGE